MELYYSTLLRGCLFGTYSTTTILLYLLMLLSGQFLMSTLTYSLSTNNTQTMSTSMSSSSSPRVPAIIVFGDSIVDPGNNNVLKTTIKCNFPPYGQDFVDHKPTGRFSNGKVPPDFIASGLGVKEYLPPYLGIELRPEDLLTGVSFASGASGYDPLTSQLASVLSLWEQLELFKEYQERVRGVAGEERTATIISDSLYIVCTGSDDIANTYFSTPFRKYHYDISSYANLMMNYASSFVEELVGMGARTVGLVGVPPIGCVPSQRTLFGGITRECSPRHNEMATLFNSRMAQELQRLSNKYPGTTILFLDIYDTLLNIIQHPSSYGFEVANKGCCGTGTVEVTLLCNSLTADTCYDDTKYIFWDSYHPTETTYKILIDDLLQRYQQYLG